MKRGALEVVDLSLCKALAMEARQADGQAKNEKVSPSFELGVGNRHDFKSILPPTPRFDIQRGDVGQTRAEVLNSIPCFKVLDNMPG